MKSKKRLSGRAGRGFGAAPWLARMVELTERWKVRVRRKFRDAKLEPDVMGSKLIEHGAICYANCVMEMENLIQEISGQSRARTKGPPASRRSPAR
jgi:hypothetical protein